MELLIAANGEISNYKLIREKIGNSHMVIGADGGAEHLRKLRITPDIIVGDLDSITHDTQSYFEGKNVKFTRHPPEKDFSDTELATQIAIDNKPDQITYIGVTGKRLDHTFANITLLKEALSHGIPARIIDENNEIRITDKPIKIKGSPGDLLSIIPLTPIVEGVTLEGLQYPLTDKEIPFGSSLGISNVFQGESAEIKLKSGLLMVIKSRD